VKLIYSTTELLRSQIIFSKFWNAHKNQLVANFKRYLDRGWDKMPGQRRGLLPGLKQSKAPNKYLKIYKIGPHSDAAFD